MTASTSQYLMIETRCNTEKSGVEDFLKTAALLAKRGKEVNLLLIQDAVFMARKTAAPAFGILVQQQNVNLLADRFSVASRSLLPAELLDHIKLVDMNSIVALMTASSCKTVWHSE